jgi:hypothetical protein
MKSKLKNLFKLLLIYLFWIGIINISYWWMLNSNFINRYYETNSSWEKVYFLVNENNIEKQESYKPVYNSIKDNLFLNNSKNWVVKFNWYYFIIDGDWIKKIDENNQLVSTMRITASEPVNVHLVRLWSYLLLLVDTSVWNVSVKNNWIEIFKLDKWIWWILFDSNFNVKDNFSINNVKIKTNVFSTDNNETFLLVDDINDSSKRYLLNLEYDPTWDYPFLNQVVELDWNYSNDGIALLGNYVYYLWYDNSKSKYIWYKFDRDLNKVANISDIWISSSDKIYNWFLFSYKSWWNNYLWYINTNNAFCTFNSDLSSSSCSTVELQYGWNVKRIIKDENNYIWFVVSNWSIDLSAYWLWNISNVNYIIFKWKNWNEYFFSKNKFVWENIISNNSDNVSILVYYFNNLANDGLTIVTSYEPNVWVNCYYKDLLISSKWEIYWVTNYNELLASQQQINPTAWVPLWNEVWAFNDGLTGFSMNWADYMKYIMNKPTITPDWHIID